MSYCLHCVLTEYQRTSNLSRIKVYLTYGAEGWEGQDQLATYVC